MLRRNIGGTGHGLLAGFGDDIAGFDPLVGRRAVGRHCGDNRALDVGIDREFLALLIGHGSDASCRARAIGGRWRTAGGAVLLGHDLLAVLEPADLRR